MSENSGFIAIAKKYRLNPVLLREIVLVPALDDLGRTSYQDPVTGFRILFIL